MAEIGNHPKILPSHSNDESMDEEREFTVNLGDDGKEHVVKGKIQDNVLNAIKAIKDVRVRMDKEKARGKQAYLIGKKGINGAINLGMPLSCVPHDSQFDMKFYGGRKNRNISESGFRQHDNKEKSFILFYVDPRGNKLEASRAQSCRIIRCPQLLKERCKLCIFAPKGETIKDALCKDGRFIPELEGKEWNLMEGKRSIPNTFSVNSLSGKMFEVELKTERGAKSGSGPNNKLIPQTSCERQLNPFHYFKTDLLDLYPDLKEQSDIINNYFKDSSHQGEKKCNALGIYKEAFGKAIKNSIRIKVLKIHSEHSESVGYIEWGDNEKEGVATCFVLCDRYILTCHHVIRLIVGGGVEEKEWARKISQSARVTFSYENRHPNQNDWFSLEEWFEISDVALDFAVLQLKRSDHTNLPAGLVQLCAPPTFNGLICIIGHPDGEAKSMDQCFVVDIFNRQQECSHRLQQGQGTECNYVNCGYDARGSNCFHMYNPMTFSEIRNNPHVVTYDTSFYGGSSGSPVFDANGHLVAMHAAGYLYGDKGKRHSIIEFGYLMTSILSRIKMNWKSWYDSEIGRAIQAGPDAGEEETLDGRRPSGDVEMDVEMEQEDEYIL
ncbi:hypothetical protein EYD10_17187 [Varanus komodoensis]|nr:hypothetical protein EYD10_17187 [Varanus komodoensis]